jgi:molecular chaperone DnaJ
MGTGPADDYYALLGIDADADVAALRRAWRRLAQQWHPDRAGPGATATFQQLAAAYAVLSDPVARAAYDRRRRTAARGSPAHGSSTSEPAARDTTARGSPARGSPAGRTSERSAGATSGESAGAAADAGSAAPRRRAPGVLLTRVSRPLDVLLAMGVARRAGAGTDVGARASADVIDLFLDEAEATGGGMVTISMRVPVRCPACAGGASSSCTHCGSRGTVDDLFSAWLAVPPGVAEGTVLTPSARLPGMIRPVSFRVRLAGTA